MLIRWLFVHLFTNFTATYIWKSSISDAGVDGEGVVGHVEGDLRNKDSKFDTINFNKLKKRFLTELTSTTSYDWTVFLLAKS